VQIGETIADKSTGKPLPTIRVEEPTVKMSFSINTSPFVGKEVHFLFITDASVLVLLTLYFAFFL
jgi:predicted membrane GTPase involved in stress response